MKADQIIKNAKIFTADKTNPLATALAVKDDKFVYVGNEAELSAYDGEVTHLDDKFIMPGIMPQRCTAAKRYGTAERSWRGRAMTSLTAISPHGTRIWACK